MRWRLRGRRGRGDGGNAELDARLSETWEAAAAAVGKMLDVPAGKEALLATSGRLPAVIAEPEPSLGAGQLVRRSPRSRRTVAGILAAGAASATAAANSVAVVAGMSGPEAGGGRPGVIQLLTKIAAVAGREPTPRVRDSQFEYVKSLQGDYVLRQAAGSGSGQARWSIHRTRPYERQIWFSVSDLCRPGLLRQGGMTVHVELPVAPGGHHRCPDRGILDDPTYRLLQSLPGSPAALLDRIHAFDNAQAGHPLRGVPADAAAFSTISQIVGESIVPPAVGAALYRAVALIPDVQMVPDAVDALGRHGVGVAFRAGWRWSPAPTEMIFDRATLQLLGTFTSPPPGSRPGHSTAADGHAPPAAFTAIQARAFVNRPGQLPRQ